MVALPITSLVLLVFNLVVLIIGDYHKKWSRLTEIQIMAVFPLVYLVSFSWVRMSW